MKRILFFTGNGIKYVTKGFGMLELAEAGMIDDLKKKLQCRFEKDNLDYEIEFDINLDNAVEKSDDYDLIVCAPMGKAYIKDSVKEKTIFLDIKELADNDIEKIIEKINK